MTEMSPLGSANQPLAKHLDLPIEEQHKLRENQGRPMWGVELKVVDEEGGELPNDAETQGNLMVRGHWILDSYFQKTRDETLTDDWFHTGDIGTLDEDGYLTITDRKKDIIVTASGKNVAPGPIESLLKRDPIITEAVLIGDRRRFITVLIVPNLPVIQQRMVNGEALASPLEELLVREDVRALFQSVVDEVNGQLSQFEQVKRFALLPTEFTIASGELTPTMKARRRVIENRWKIAIEELYVD